MKTFLLAIALTAVTGSAALARSAVQYYNTLPSSRSPAIVSDPSPHGFSAGDYVWDEPDQRVPSQLLSAPPDGG